MSEYPEGGESEEEINEEYNSWVERVFGSEAVTDEQPMRESLGKLPMGGAIIMPDPGDLDPVRYNLDNGLTERDILRAAIEGVRMAYEAPLTEDTSEQPAE
jgi:hypothetical protein